MIVACPKCRKQYRLDATRLMYCKLPDNSGLGVRLACSNCHEQWWEVKKERTDDAAEELRVAPPERPFKNLTDLSLLYNGGGALNNRREAFRPAVNPVRFSVIPEKFATEPEPEPDHVSGGEPNEPMEPVKWRQIVKVALLSLALFAGIVGLATLAMGYVPSLTDKTKTPDDRAIDLGAVVTEDARFVTKPFDAERQRVIVIGKLKNPTDSPLPLKNLKISAFGACAAGEKPDERGLCHLRSWSYKWKQDSILPGEVLVFKSAAKVRADVSVSQVYVDANPAD